MQINGHNYLIDYEGRPKITAAWEGRSGRFWLAGWRVHWPDPPPHGRHAEKIEKCGWVELGPISLRYTSGHVAFKT